MDLSKEEQCSIIGLYAEELLENGGTADLFCVNALSIERVYELRVLCYLLGKLPMLDGYGWTHTLDGDVEVSVANTEEFQEQLSSLRLGIKRSVVNFRHPLNIFTKKHPTLYSRLSCENTRISDMDKFRSVILGNVDSGCFDLLDLSTILESKLLPQNLLAKTAEVWQKTDGSRSLRYLLRELPYCGLPDWYWKFMRCLESHPDNLAVRSVIAPNFEEEYANYGIGGKVDILELRGYQIELARRAVAGENTIICAPTGSGKTWVAVEIIMKHLQNSENAKQSEVLRRYLRDRWRIGGISGGETDINKAEHIFFNHVTVMTPQILLNALQDPFEERQLSLTQITLLVFDECHHCDQKHPYNDTMVIYHDTEFCGKIGEGERLPQVVGLTASLGVGSSDTRQTAVDHVVRMAANMAAHSLSVVREEQMSLEEYVNVPKDELIQVPASYRRSPFTIHIGDMMKTVEGSLTTQLNGLVDVFASQLRGVPLAPRAERFSLAYQSWVDQLLNVVPRLHDRHLQESLYSYLQFLKICYCALELNAHVPVDQALSYMQREMGRFTGLTSADQDCKTLFQNRYHLLEQCAAGNRPNELAERLCEELRKHYSSEGEKDSRTIIFVKTRELTVEVKKFLNKDAELTKLNPEQLTSVNTSTEKFGQSLSDQKRVLGDFHYGKCRLVVATSVAEEGLDVAKCSLIIKYNHVSNEIALAQRRGRGRAQGSKSILLVQEGSIADREMNNMLKEKLMKIALKIVQDAGPIWFRKEVERKAKKFYLDRQMERNILNKQRLDLGDKKYDISCKKCGSAICDSDGIRTVQNHHYVCTNPKIWDRDHP